MTRPDLPRSAAGRFNPWLIAVIVSAATFMEILDTTIANVSLRHIAGNLGTGQDESTYILTSYMVANAVVLPISGWLSNVVGRKRFYMICVALFTVSSALCGLSSSLGMMIVFRILQGLGGGGLAPVEQSIFADTFTPSQRTLAFALYGFTIVTAPAIGPVLGGLITDHFSWRWVFMINVPVGTISLILTAIFVSDSAQTKADRRALLARGFRVDYIGFLLVVLGFGAMQVVLDRYEREDGFSSPLIVICTAVSVIALVSLTAWELIHPNPMVHVRLLKIPAFAISSVIFFVFGFTIMATTQLLPQFTQELLGYTATSAGMTLALGGVITVILMPVAGIVTGRVFQPKWLAFTALCGIAAALYFTAGFDLDMTFTDVALSRAILVTWLPFIFIPLSAVQFIGVPPQANNDASAIVTLTRNLGGSVGIALVTTELAWRRQFHHARIAEHVTAFNGYGPGHALGGIARLVQTQASLLSYLDIFVMLAVVTLVVAPLALLLPRVPRGASAVH